MTDQPSEKARYFAQRLVREFRPQGWPAKEHEIAMTLDLAYSDPEKTAREAFKAGFEQALHNSSLSPEDFFEVWWNEGRFYQPDQSETGD